ncbi:YciI family protein [Synechococcus sp. RedBA-s]|uniref:YciI family protein n=1 Tax=Synechococcus sp. RedBA-s TaxID=2823741 RepID=UPI0020CEBDA4|nr:YciI family protein [Synechococcus sp. RedBA-s]
MALAADQGLAAAFRSRLGPLLRGLALPWFVKLEQGQVDRAHFDAHLRDHLDWVADLQRRGHQASSGYWRERKGMNGDGAGGMLLFQARDWQEAEAIVLSDPLVRSGCVSWVMHEWRVVAGVMQEVAPSQTPSPSQPPVPW